MFSFEWCVAFRTIRRISLIGSIDTAWNLPELHQHLAYHPAEWSALFVIMKWNFAAIVCDAMKAHVSFVRHVINPKNCCKYRRIRNPRRLTPSSLLPPRNAKKLIRKLHPPDNI